MKLFAQRKESRNRNSILILTLLQGLSFVLLTGGLFFASTAALAFGILGALICSCSLIYRIYKREKEISFQIKSLQTSFGLPNSTEDSLGEGLAQVVRELERRNDALCSSLLDKQIGSDHDLAHALEKVAALAKDLLSADTAEIALFDTETGSHQSSFVVGLPGTEDARHRPRKVQKSALDGSPVETSLYRSETPISFAGNVLGVLRTTLPAGRSPASGDQEVLDLLASQASIAIINTEYTKQIFRMKQASDESVRAKTGFLANLSHELRGPLGIMLNAVELVLDKLCGNISEEQAEILGMVKANGSHLLELINDVLDYAKVESGKLTPTSSDILVNELLTDLAAVVRKQADSKRHRLNIRKLDEALAISCDKRHIRQILINLLTNAIKYTPDGGEIELFAERQANQRIRISVKDSGIGIAESDREKVFAAFERIENSYSVTQVGTGLGMALTRKLVNANGGTIDFESEVNKGSHFYVNFPAIDSGDVRYEQDSQEMPKAKGQGEVVLIAQKHEGERRMLSRYLVHLGFCVVQAESSQSLLSILSRQDVNLLILDNDIVDTNDSDVVGHIRDTTRRISVPMILVSSRAFSFDIEHYLRAGIDLCLLKPLDLNELGHASRQLIDAQFPGLGLSELSAEQETGPLSGRIIKPEEILH